MVANATFSLKRNVRIFQKKGHIMLDLETGNMNSNVTGVMLSPQTYDNWYRFKKDLESLCGHPILNTTWLKVKPREALPWGKSQIITTLLKVN